MEFYEKKNNHEIKIMFLSLSLSFIAYVFLDKNKNVFFSTKVFKKKKYYIIIIV